MPWVRARLCKLQKGCTQLTAASDKVYQLLAHGRWFSPGTPASSTTKTGRHDIAEILLKVTLKHQKSNQSINQYTVCIYCLHCSLFIWENMNSKAQPEGKMAIWQYIVKKNVMEFITCRYVILIPIFIIKT